ncbi:CDP-glycerol glycerophosphotransferase family protein [Sphingobium subterraneum]|uniref:Uncharacterized protein n=1 Tax=Sphingobium subterraneum TaxID=627688 RepID=A0A841J1D8_9SPHN|nr:CDP-glycerol glycerophosphotransferase family protein [Sphingobium subterraneum]MBB6124753.1 hypothetical protein [Sphingobium subterraneum]
MKVGFLFNHDQAHQVAHALPVALALRREYPEVEVIVATTNSRLTDEVRRLSARLDEPIHVEQLGLRSRTTRALSHAFETILPIAKIGMYRDNLDFFRSLDALVVTEKTSLLLKTRYHLDLKIIHTRHGAGDRAIGFNKASAGFDHVLVSGTKIRDRLVRDAGVAPEKLSTVGYPKFDLMPDPAPRLTFQANGKPTVLYNPHPSPHLSSWYKEGRAVLDTFLNDDRFNLIFAPHVMLFHRSFTVTIDRLRVDRPGTIDRRYHDAPNILIDLGSAASTDMTYTAAADIYLGDVSSQIYEFLYRPRPCIFLNSQHVDWRGDPNYAHWQAGEVIDNVADLRGALDRALADPNRYRDAQQDLFARSFELTEEASSVRAARAIMAVLGAKGVEP